MNTTSISNACLGLNNASSFLSSYDSFFQLEHKKIVLDKLQKKKLVLIHTSQLSYPHIMAAVR